MIYYLWRAIWTTHLPAPLDGTPEQGCWPKHVSHSIFDVWEQTTVCRLSLFHSRLWLCLPCTSSPACDYIPGFTFDLFLRTHATTVPCVYSTLSNFCSRPVYGNPMTNLPQVFSLPTVQPIAGLADASPSCTRASAACLLPLSPAVPNGSSTLMALTVASWFSLDVNMQNRSFLGFRMAPCTICSSLDRSSANCTLINWKSNTFPSEVPKTLSNVTILCPSAGTVLRQFSFHLNKAKCMISMISLMFLSLL